MNPDLFPETLLVDIADGHTFTTSLKVAEHFHKRHDNVIRDISNVINDVSALGVSALNFEASNYKTSRGKTLPMFKMDRKAFAVLAGRFTGKQALRWQIDFYDAFDAMETELRAHVAREAKALHQLRPLLAPVVAGTEQGLRRAAIGATVNRSARSITYHRRVARTLGLLPLAH